MTPTDRALHDYAPLYFGRKTPMASALRELNNSLIFLAFDFNILLGRPCIITDANTTFREFNSVDDLQILDPKSINTHLYAHNEEIKHPPLLIQRTPNFSGENLCVKIKLN